VKEIVVVGPGAMGLLFAFRFSECGFAVTLLDYRPARALKIDREGIQLIEAGGVRRHRTVRCVSDPKACESADFVFLWVKAHDTERALLHCLPVLKPEGILVSFQNGIRHVDIIRSYLPASQTVFGTTAQGATLIGTNCVRHCGSGETIVAKEVPNRAAVRSVLDLLCSSGIKSYQADDLPFVLWRKLVFNAAINPITSILGVRNGQLPKIPEAWLVARACFEEAKDVGTCLVGSKVAQIQEEELREVCKITGENQSSMLQDLRRGKPTEIDAINGVVVEEGSKLGRPTPVNQTMVNLVRASVKAGK